MKPLQEIDSLALARAAQAVDTTIAGLPKYAAFKAEVVKRLPLAPDPLAEYERILEAHVPLIYDELDKNDLNGLNAELKKFIEARKTVMDRVLTRTRISAEVTHQRPADKPEMINLRFMLTKSLGAPAADTPTSGAAASLSAAGSDSGAIANHSFSLNPRRHCLHQASVADHRPLA